jgi:putative transposase
MASEPSVSPRRESVGATLAPATAAADEGPPGPEPWPCERACVLTVTTLFRRPVFRDPRAARAVAQLQARTLPPDRAAWLAWVLMPDHWQGLLVCGRDDSLAALVGRFKAMTTRAVDPRHRVNGWLWGRGHREAPLATDQSLGDAARILVAAPRRAGLVTSLADYPYWQSAWDPDAACVTDRTQEHDA